MKLNFEWKNDQRYHQYCLACHAEKIEPRVIEGKTFYYCLSCNSLQERSIVIDPKIVWWIDKTGEYWHESIGIFIHNRENKYLFFKRTIFPFVLTVPSGHVDINESISNAAIRELKEETGLVYKEEDLIKISTDQIYGDSCRRGSDAHLWHAFLLTVPQNVKPEIKEEGLSPIWLTLADAIKEDITFPIRYVINNRRNEFV